MSILKKYNLENNNMSLKFVLTIVSSNLVETDVPLNRVYITNTTTGCW